MSAARDSAAAPARVLYVLKRFPRLSETFVLREILALEAAGVRVSVDSLLPPEQGLTHRELSQVQASVRYLPRRPELRERALVSTHLRLALRRPLRWIAVALRSRRLGGWRRFLQAGLVAERARAEGITHLHAHFVTAATEVVTMAAQLGGVSCSVTAHAKDIHHRDNRDLVRTRLVGCSTVITVSRANVAHLQAVLDPINRAADVRLIRNGVPTLAPARPGRANTILCVARLVPKKGVDVLLQAAALLAPRYPELRVDIIGTGPLADDLLRLRDEAGLADVVHFLGTATSCEVSEAMRNARVVVLPCRVDDSGDRDGMPTVLVEAMAHGVPVISCDVAGVSELVRDGVTGLLVASDDSPALAEAIAELISDPQRAARLGNAGHRLVGASYRPDEATRRLLQVFGLQPGTAPRDDTAERVRAAVAL